MKKKKVKKKHSVHKRKKSINLKKYLILSGFVVLFTLVLLLLFQYYFVGKSVRLDKRYEITGMDVSQHQGKINWKILKDEGIGFVFIKATEGAVFIDKRYKYNRNEAEKYKILQGYYHFYRFNKSGIEQAENYIKNVSLFSGNLYPCVDIETWGNKFHSKTKTEIIKNIRDYISVIKLHYGVYPIIYTNMETYNLYIKNNFNECPLWICDLTEKPRIDRPWIFWQYSHVGNTEATRYKIDLNVFYGTKKELQQYMMK